MSNAHVLVRAFRSGTSSALLFVAATFALGALQLAMPSQMAHAAGGQCKWEGGSGVTDDCKREDCIADGGKAECSEVQRFPYNNYTDYETDDEKFEYDSCAGSASA